MEAELFGYARGAFSGAVQQYDGQLMAAQGGTVFLDEIDDTPLETQVKLLRVLEDRVVSRLGQNEWHEVDFRLLAATNRDLAALAAQGLFGEDLYARLAIVTIRLPPLRERPEDVEELALQFAARFVREQQRSGPMTLGPQVVRALQAYAWPGNIRELRNVIYETLVYKRAGTEILLSDLPARVLKRSAGRGAAADSEIARRVRAGHAEPARGNRVARADGAGRGPEGGRRQRRRGRAPARPGRSRRRTGSRRHRARDDAEAAQR